MCGILGSINIEITQEMIESLQHRGPDGGGLESFFVDDASVILAHRRLAILGLGDEGRQPMFSKSGRWCVSFNGEIYNHNLLRQALKGVDWYGGSDTETLVNHLDVFGIDGITELNGIFAFAALDLQSRKLYLVRDRYGVKPLYYCQKEDRTGLIFSSEMHPILSQLGETDLDLDSMATALRMRYFPAPTTPYEGVSKVRPGHVIEFDIVSQVWSERSYLPRLRPLRDLSFDQALREYGELFEQAIERQMLADVEVGVLLSGGIDSALVAYFANKFSMKPIKTFTVGYDVPHEADETIAASETASLIGSEHFSVKISKNQFDDALPQCARIVEEPSATTSVVPMYYLAKLVAETKLKVVLTGQGADEPLGGYRRYQFEKLASPAVAKLMSVFEKFANVPNSHLIGRGIRSMSETDDINRWISHSAVFTLEEIKKLIGIDEKNARVLVDYFKNLVTRSDRDNVSKMMLIDQHMNLADDLLLYTDKIMMGRSIEARVPMLDNDLMEFINRLPTRFKIKHYQGKYIHKKFAEKVLPRKIVNRRKLGFETPFEDWYGKEAMRALNEAPEKPHSLMQMHFSKEFVNRELHDLLSSKKGMQRHLMLLQNFSFLANDRKN